MGWLPYEPLAALVGPMIIYLLPLLIGFTGGRLVYGFRGGVMGATATMGVIVSSDIPMFAGAMIMGPLAGYVMKKSTSYFWTKFALDLKCFTIISLQVLSAVFWQA